MTKNHKSLPFNYGHQIAATGQFRKTEGRQVRCTFDKLQGYTIFKAIQSQKQLKKISPNR